MKILKSWLKEHIDIDDNDEQLSDLLTFSGTLVEQVISGIDRRIIVGKILQINPHPNADKLKLVKVLNGSGEVDVVCGANNIEVGQIVPLATIGAIVGSLEINEVEIRGEKSHGMLCSMRELALSDDHSGIYILPEHYQIGRSLAEYIDSDSVFDLEITPNRGDCLSHLGIARELSAITGKKTLFDIDAFKFAEKQSGNLKIEIQNNEHAHKYCAAVIRGVKIAPSPEWLRQRLLAVDHSVINNVVDITNFVMEDLGQPLHAFDKNKLSSEKIIVRDAREGESIVTIDGKECKLDRDMLMICDEQKAIAVAGVMGGENSAVDDQTTDIVLESAVFDRKSVRKTAKLLNITSDASYRFERGVDENLTKTALLKAAEMICQIAGGEVTELIEDVAREEKNEYVTVEYDRINELLGTSLERKEIDRYLLALGFNLEDGMALPASYRHDIFLWQDLAEEVARLHGFKNIPMVAMSKMPAPKNADYYYKEKLKDILVDLGYSEVFTYPFLSDGDIATVGVSPNELLEVANPVQSENKYMRNSLVPGLMRAVAKNPTFETILIFEFGNVFLSDGERTKISVASSGRDSKKSIQECVKILSERTKTPPEKFEIKEFLRDDLTKYKIKKPSVFAFEIDSAILVSAMREAKADVTLSSEEKIINYKEISKFPPVKRDLSVVVDAGVDADCLSQEICTVSKNVVLCELFDEFESEKLGKGKKSIAFHLWLEDLDKTLLDNEADEQVKKIIEFLQEKYSAKIRS